MGQSTAPVATRQGEREEIIDMNEENNRSRKWSTELELDPEAGADNNNNLVTMFYPADLAYCQRRREFYCCQNLSRNLATRKRSSSLSSMCHISLCVILLCSLLTTCSAQDQEDVELSRDAKQLVVRPSSPGQFGGQHPPRRLMLPGNGNENINSKLQNGPLTLHNGRLRPVATIERIDKNVELDFESSMSGTTARPTNHNFPVRSFGGPGKKLPNQRLGGNRANRRNTGLQSFFPQNNVPFSYNSKPVPEVFLNDFSDSNDFENFENQRPRPPRPGETGDNEVSPSEMFLDWSTKVSQSKDSQQKVNLDTKYFSITYPDTERMTVRTTTDPGLTYIGGKPGLVLRKVKGRMKTSTTVKPEVSSEDVNRVLDATRVLETDSDDTDVSDLCKGDIIECDTTEAVTDGGTEKNLTMNNKDLNIPGSPPGSILPSYAQLLKHFKKDVWVIPVLAAAGLIVLVLVIFEIYLLSKTINKNPSRRHLFLGQMLLLGLLACAAMSTIVTLQPTPVTCATMRLGTGLAYSLVYSTLLVKLVFLISLNSGVYLPATYQSLLLCFAILIQLVIGIQWLVTSPPDVVDNKTDSSDSPEAELVFTCATMFKQQLLGLLYVVFLILVVVVLSFKSRGVRENYREAMYVGLTMGFTVAIWTIWIVAGLIVPSNYQDVCIAGGLLSCTAITFIIMFMPKGRQLSAMGKEGVYAEDRTDVYTGDSGTGSTGSSGTPSPSFFPVKPHHKVNHGYHHDHHHHDDTKEFKERLRDRERLETPQLSHRNLQLFGAQQNQQQTQQHGQRGHHVTIQDLHEHIHHLRRGRGRSSSPGEGQPAHMYGHPLFRSSHGDIHRASTRHKELSRFSSHRDLTRSEPVRASRRRRRDSHREIQSTISPRRLGSGCVRCHVPGHSGHHRGHDDNIYTSLETLHNTTAHSDRYPYKSKPSRHNPNVLFRRPNDMPSGILY